MKCYSRRLCKHRISHSLQQRMIVQKLSPAAVIMSALPRPVAIRAQIERGFRILKALDTGEEYSGDEFGAAVAERAAALDDVVQRHDLGEVEGAVAVDVELVEETRVLHVGIAFVPHEG